MRHAQTKIFFFCFLFLLNHFENAISLSAPQANPRHRNASHISFIFIAELRHVLQSTISLHIPLFKYEMPNSLSCNGTTPIILAPLLRLNSFANCPEMLPLCGTTAIFLIPISAAERAISPICPALPFRECPRICAFFPLSLGPIIPRTKSLFFILSPSPFARSYYQNCFLRRIGQFIQH